MKIEQLERFLMVAECLNFTTAAEKLYVGQSTISRQIAALEYELGVTLLIRGPRSVELTAAGVLLKQEGTKLVNYIDQLTKRIQDAGRLTTGTLRITSIPAYIPALSELQTRISDLYPSMNLTFNRASYDAIPHQLDIGTTDIGVTFSFWDQMDPAYDRMPLCEEHFCIVCGRRHWAANRESTGIYLDELRDEQFYFGREALHLCHHPLDFDNSVVQKEGRSHGAFTSLEDMLMHLNIIPGVAVLPSVVAHTVRDNLACIPLLDEDLKHHLILLWRKDNPSPVLPFFLECTAKMMDDVSLQEQIIPI